MKTKTNNRGKWLIVAGLAAFLMSAFLPVAIIMGIAFVLIGGTMAANQLFSDISGRREPPAHEKGGKRVP